MSLPIILYHQVKPNVDCPDGVVSAWIANKKYPDAQIIGCCYQSKFPDFSDYDSIILVDFSLPKEIIKEMLKAGKEIIIYDHHLTAFNELSSFNLGGKIDISGEYCGATLIWKELLPGLKPPIFLKYIQDRDNWDFKYEQTQFIHEAFSKLRSLCPDLSSKFSLFDVLEHLNEDQFINWLVPIGRELLGPKLEAVNKACERAKTIDFFQDYNVLGVHLTPDEERLTSDICMKLYGDNHDVDFVCCITNATRYELRSNKWGNNFDVSEVAKKYGGGGHRNAAGFILN